MSRPDPRKLADWQIAEEYEKSMKTVYRLAEELGILHDELLPNSHYYGKVDFEPVLERLGDRPDGKYIDVTAITPTPLGEGKSTSTIGLLQGLGRRGKKATGAIRQPSGGPTMNIKGSAAGGGLSQCIPLIPFSFGLTGDINDIMNAHNLAMVALTARMQHEFNYDDAMLATKHLRRLNIDPRSVETGWVIDFCAQSLRKIMIGMGGTTDGFLMESKFQIAASSELMAILAVSKSLADMRKRIGNIVMAYIEKRRARHHRRPRGRRRHDRLDVQHPQAESTADTRGPAPVRARRPLREHSDRPVVHRGRHARRSSSPTTM